MGREARVQHIVARLLPHMWLMLLLRCRHGSSCSNALTSSSSHWRVVVNSGKAAGARPTRLAGSAPVAAATAAASASSVMVAACSLRNVRDTCRTKNSSFTRLHVVIR